MPLAPTLTAYCIPLAKVKEFSTAVDPPLIFPVPKDVLKPPAPPPPPITPPAPPPAITK